jgi:hypothetical protein
MGVRSEALRASVHWGKVQWMARCEMVRWLWVAVMCGAVGVACAEVGVEPSVASTTAFDGYVRGVESRLAQRQDGNAGVSAADWERLRRGEIVVVRMTPAEGVAMPGAMLHHWRGTAFVPGARAADLERLLREFSAYPRLFAPEVLSAKVLSGGGDHVQVTMRVKQKHGITVVMDATYDVTFARVAGRGESVSRSTRIAEIASPGTREEHALSAADEHGFLWRQNTYWSYEERDGGLLMQIESVSLSRAIPHGLAWAVGPFVESVPRDSLEFTLRSVCSGLKHDELKQ